MNVVAVTGPTINYHKTPADLYDQLVAAFGEIHSDQNPRLSWVSFGAGPTALTFWKADPR